MFEPLFNEHTVFWAASLFGSWAALTAVFSFVGPFKKKPGLAAHHVVMIAPFAYLAYQGTLHWNTTSTSVPSDAHSRLFFTIKPLELFAPTMLGLQIFDLATTLFVPGMGKADAMAHHVVSLLLAYKLTSTGFLQYWEPFYFGMLEVSSIPLCFVDLFRSFPLVAKRFDALNEVMRVAFAATFLPIRCIYMPYISYHWWSGFLSLYNAGDKQVTANIVLFSVFGGINIFLCVLQQYWGFKIVNAAIKMASGDKKSREKEY